ncbi:MAG: 1-deoxy-D-xylulose-5-phosphate synthase [Pyrinomonadaceae bacterium]
MFRETQSFYNHFRKFEIEENLMLPKTRIMWIEYKGADEIVGSARIGRVTIKNRGKSLEYKDQKFSSLNGQGFKSNYFDLETHENYWISGCHKDGRDALYSTTVEIDEDIREEYWTETRNKPELKHISSFRCQSKY